MFRRAKRFVKGLSIRLSSPTVGGATALTGVLIAGLGIWISHSDREVNHSLIVESGLRNVTTKESIFASDTQAKVGDVVEYSLKAINTGNKTLSNVTIRFIPPWRGEAQVQKSTCEFRASSDQEFSKCPDSPSQKDLYVKALEADDRSEARVRFIVVEPVCQDFDVEQDTYADSDETSQSGSARSVIRYSALRDAVPKCDTRVSKLRAWILSSTRSTCDAWSKALPHGMSARVACFPKRAGIRFAVYEAWHTRAAAGKRFKDSLKQTYLSRCGKFRDGLGVFDGKVGEYRVACYRLRNGDAAMFWVNKEQRIYGYAHSKHANPGELLDWWRSYG